MSSGLFLCTIMVLFGMGAMGTFQNRRNFQIMLLCIEVMLLSVNMVFLTGSVAVDDQNGQLMALWVLTAAAAETALGQALCVQYFRLRSTLDVEQISLMKGSFFLQFFGIYTLRAKPVECWYWLYKVVKPFEPFLIFCYKHCCSLLFSNFFFDKK